MIHVKKAAAKVLALLLALMLILSAVVPVSASEPDDAAAYIQQMLDYYVHYQSAADTDITRLIGELRRNHPDMADAWENIMDYFAWVDSEMVVEPDILPDGLPEDDSLCIVVLGYALNPYGSMKDELVSRLEVALASAVKYPNAYILCTGGGTASRSKNKTEAGQMASWLKKHGIEEERIIIEDESLSTIQNAQFSCRILTAEYPQVRHLAVISSDYHVPRGCLYFNTQLAITACETGTEPLNIVAGAGCRIAHSGSDALSYLASGVAQIAGVSYSYKSSEKPQLSSVTGLVIDGEFTYEVGTAMTLTATAQYDTGFSRDVTAEAVFSGVDMSQPGEQLLTVSYTENSKEVIVQLLIDVTAGPYAAVFEETSEPVQETQPPDPTVPATGSPAPLWPFILFAALLALLALLVRLKIRGRKK